MHRAFDIAASIVVVTGLLVMTRPGSQGSALVKAIFSGFSGALATAAGATPSGFRAAPTK